jgi:hypothetical protein
MHALVVQLDLDPRSTQVSMRRTSRRPRRPVAGCGQGRFLNGELRKFVTQTRADHDGSGPVRSTFGARSL